MTSNTMVQTDSINELKQAVRKASNHERALALELDAMPAKLEKAVKQDVRRRAAAARSGEALSVADEISEVSALRQRAKELPLLIWAAQVDHAAKEVEQGNIQVEHHKREREKASSGLEGLKIDADEAKRKLDKKLKDIRGHEFAASSVSRRRAEAEKRLRFLEQEHPNV